MTSAGGGGGGGGRPGGGAWSRMTRGRGGTRGRPRLGIGHEAIHSSDRFPRPPSPCVTHILWIVRPETVNGRQHPRVPSVPRSLWSSLAVSDQRTEGGP